MDFFWNFWYDIFGDIMDCVFCKIVKGEIPSYRIYDDDKIMAFLDINPNTPGHTLIIPKEHTTDLNSISNETLFYIMEKARDIANLVVSKMEADGYTLLQNNGIIQDVKHFHLHIIPRYKESMDMDVKAVYEKITQ